MGFQSIKTIKVAEGNKYFKVIDGVLFTMDEKTLWLYPSGDEATSYSIPKGTEIIGKGAFNDNQNLETILIPDSVTTISGSSFFGLKGLKTITFPENITSMGISVLRSCPNVETVILKNSCGLDANSLYDCESLKTIIIDGKFSGFKEYCMYNLPSLENYVVKKSNWLTDRDGVLYAGKELLRYPSGRKESKYIVPEDTTIIFGLAFNHLSTLTDIILPPGVKVNVLAFHYPNKTQPMNIYFRDKESVNLLGRFIIPVSNIAGITVEYTKRQSAADEELEEQVRSL